jgi:16S rRNA (adenine1518-N6/adenine1519-N6)-dimethyltransferase
MVQEEVARRMAATPDSPSKQYGLLSILSQFWSEVEIVRLVGRKSFYPAPKVNSALVRLTVRETPRLEPPRHSEAQCAKESLCFYKHFRRVIKAAFSQRRKNIKNCLVSGGFTKEAAAKALDMLGIDQNTRGEKLSIEQFGKLSEELND